MIPLTRHGWREMVIGSLLLAAVAAGLGLLAKPAALLVLPFAVWLFAFFRDPNRSVPPDTNILVSPADGTVSDITEIAHDELLGGPAVRVGIFLSVFNVHVNRSPCSGRVISIQYKKGKFLNAMNHSGASEQNESNTIVMAEPQGERPVVVVRQIVGLIARRIVCTAVVGQRLARGEHIGMIKFGSRTELTIAKWLEPHIEVSIGQKVRGAADIIARLGQPMQTVVPAAGSPPTSAARETPA